MIVAKQKIVKGTVVKMAVLFDYPSDPRITLDTIEDWHTDWFCSGKHFKVRKDEHLQDENGDWFALVNTGVTGDGILKMRLWANIPDKDSPTGYRPEGAEIETDVVIG